MIVNIFVHGHADKFINLSILMNVFLAISCEHVKVQTTSDIFTYTQRLTFKKTSVFEMILFRLVPKTPYRASYVAFSSVRNKS